MEETVRVDEETHEEEIPQEEEIHEEEIPQEEIGPEEETGEEDLRKMNTIIPTMIAHVVFGPTMQASGEPASPDDLKRAYISFTAPILDMIDFHTCLSFMGELSPKVRLIIGVITLGAGIVLFKPRVKKEPKKDEAGTV